MPIPITLDHQATVPDDVELVAVGVRSAQLEADAPGLDEELARIAGFEGKLAQTLVAATDEGVQLLVGLGDEADPTTYRKVGAAIAKAAVKRASIAVDVLVDLDGPDRVAAAGALAEGLALGSYGFADYKDPAPGTALEAVTVVGKGGKRVADAVARGARVAEAVGLVRDLVNTPGGDLTPTAFAEQAIEVADEAGIEIEVLDLAAITEAGLGGLLGVARGSAQEPRFVKLSYVPEGRPRGKVALVGKGVTFDSGGLSIKSAGGMEGMKGDMAGAATVLAALSLVPTVAPKLQVTGYLPLTDNMLGPDATRVGDVLRTRNGKTVEVLNTDAEGRLILADGLALAVEDEPDAIIDLATLTGACMVALGDRTAGVFTNSEALAERVLDAADEAGELFWPLPMPEHLRKPLDSEIADLRNIGVGGYGGASTAAIFLQEFVGDVPWAHLDIAGPADSKGAYDEVSKGGTGFGVRTLVRLLGSWTKLP
ncbi:leucyl aminopeptidase [Aquihabitans sp. G128]|uniref:leucyl aminopeptidase n=1 Tax=Aquihabitans sp. G128 TaxID=2849779 RepID=UPI001C22A505|nr:leucyl aminopeptidase [Aquihabitans sp. G128]QXC61355.1 leucyl aminopeptidase [Aquihabitans sp. G128]